ncbi:MAG: carboxypeptidase-like regulatory domain-containing protein [Cyclobacteriaceae bacterium]|nr:carboxypeptidase-like regulatory domain-containing protein [Cyclobacteriaceae bacterium]
MRVFYFIVFCFTSLYAFCQTATGRIAGRLTHQNSPIEFAHIVLLNSTYGTTSNEKGDFALDAIPAGHYKLQASSIGYQTHTVNVIIKAGESRVGKGNFAPSLSQNRT